MEDKNQTKHAVIDIGSNTIRTVIYALDREHNTARELISERDFTGIIAYVKYGQLCEAGRLRLVEVLRRMKEFCDIANCKNISCFSTASLRDADDIEEIRERVKNETGIDIRPLSAEEEALYDLEGLRYANVSPTGTGLDLGGGSCQIFRYNENGFAASKSMKIGCLTMSDAFVHGIFPTKHEAKKIRDKVRRALGISKKECVVENLPLDFSFGFSLPSKLGTFAQALSAAPLPQTVPAECASRERHGFFLENFRSVSRKLKRIQRAKSSARSSSVVQCESSARTFFPPATP